MRILGIILLIAGVLMIIFTGINFQTEKKVADIGPIEINKKENKHMSWPVYAGIIVCGIGITVLVVDRKK